MPKWSILASFYKPEDCGKTVLPNRLILFSQKLIENAKSKIQYDILSGQKLVKSAQKGHFYEFLKT